MTGFGCLVKVPTGLPCFVTVIDSPGRSFAESSPKEWRNSREETVLSEFICITIIQQNGQGKLILVSCQAPGDSDTVPGIPMKTTPESSREGFTRIEVVALIAAIAMVGTIPLAALNRNREGSWSAADLNNVRQIMAAATIYTLDNSDFLPHPTWGTVPIGVGGWAYAIDNKAGIPGVPAKIPSAQGQEDNTAQLPFARQGQLAPYLRSLQVLECPKDVQQRTDPVYRELYLDRPCKITSYNWNGAASGYVGTQRGPYRLSDFRGTDILQWEANEERPFNFNDASANPTNPYEGVSQRHGYGTAYTGAPDEGGGSGTVGHFDGQAKLLRHGDFTNLRDSGTPNAVLCGPAFRN